MCVPLSAAKHDTASFDVAISGPSVHESDMLEETARILKPGGRVFLCEPVSATQLKTADSLQRAMKLAGFIEISQVSYTYGHCSEYTHIIMLITDC